MTAAQAANVGREQTFNLPSAGNVYLRFYAADTTEICPSGARAGLYLDGTPLPDTSETIPASGTTPTEWVAVAHAGSGQHTADLRKDCPGGTLGGGFDDDAHSDWTVVLLGG